MRKYLCDVIDGKTYLRGLCCPGEDYSDWVTVETEFWADNKFLDENGRPRWRVYSPDDIRDEPLPMTAAEEQHEHERGVKAQLAIELPDLIYANKDDPAALSQALCDRAKEIDSGAEIRAALEKL